MMGMAQLIVRIRTVGMIQHVVHPVLLCCQLVHWTHPHLPCCPFLPPTMQGSSSPVMSPISAPAMGLAAMQDTSTQDTSVPSFSMMPTSDSFAPTIKGTYSGASVLLGHLPLLLLLIVFVALQLA